MPESHRIPENLREVFDAHADYVWRVLRRLGVSESDVPDVGQEVFCVVSRRLSEFEGRSGIRTWLYAICRRCAAAHRRRAPLRREVVMPRPPEAPIEATPHSELEHKRLVQLVDQVLATLDAQQRDVYVLSEIEGMPMQQVAEAVGLALKTAYRRRADAQRSIRAALVARGRSVA